MGKDQATKVAIVGLGRQGRAITCQILDGSPDTRIICVCDESPESFEKFAEGFLERGLQPPTYERDLHWMLHKYGDELDAAIIATPPSAHCEQSVACLKAGLHVLLEKQMTDKVSQAMKLVKVCEHTERILSVAFQGNFRPETQKAKEILSSGEIGQIQTIQATIWQNWQTLHLDEWRLDPEIAAGGFFFDTASHALNAVCNLAAEDFGAISAEFDYKGTPVEINAAVRGRLRSRALVNILATGNTTKSCGSDVRVYCSRGILRTTAWGDSLEILREQPADWRLTGTSTGSSLVIKSA